MKDAEKLPSDHLAGFLKYLDLAKHDYDYHFRNVNEKDKEHQDHIHALELDGLKYKERARLATKMQISRVERRKSKDMVDVLEPLYKYLEDETNKRAVNKLRQVLGDIRKREERLNNRVYHKRTGGQEYEN